MLLSDSAHALFVRATYLVCHRLISSWKGDLNVSLAALELLAGLARTPIRDTGKLSLSQNRVWLLIAMRAWGLEDPTGSLAWKKYFADIYVVIDIWKY